MIVVDCAAMFYSQGVGGRKGIPIDILKSLTASE